MISLSRGETEVPFLINDDLRTGHHRRVPAGAARRDLPHRPERSGGRKGAQVLRGEANPCARAPFWHLRSSTGGVAGAR
jgi:hypothetical protein